MTNKKINILKRVYLISIILLIFALCIIFKLSYIQLLESDKYNRLAQKTVIKSIKTPAIRGNIYSANGHLLATSIIRYDIRIDLVTIPESIFNNGYKSLADSLSKIFPFKSKDYFIKKIKKERKKRNRYLLLSKNVDFTTLERFKKFPVLKKGPYKGGLIIEQKITRKRPLGKIAERSIGYDDYRGRVGMEGAFSTLLKGEDGKRLKQKIGKNIWKPLNDTNELEPIDGSDIYTTIDIEIQDIMHQALLKTLKKFQAHHGCAVVMDVKTGEIRAIVNLTKNKKNKYYEKINYAIQETIEPGSTFKLMSFIAAMEDGKINLKTTIDTQNGKYKFYDKWVRDSNGKGYGKINVLRAFEVSSNVAVTRLIYNHYVRTPESFVNRLYKMGLRSKLNIPIQGEGIPKIPTPRSPEWSGISLPWMAYGYGIMLTPLQILTFYNSIANNGKTMKPIFIKKIKKNGKVQEVFNSEITNYKICSDNTVKQAQRMLEGVIKRGTAKNIYTSKFSMAGKSGTTQTNYFEKESKKNVGYISSFAGYFPANDPKYSCIVVVNNPNKDIGYYGSKIAAPVFSEIAHKLYVKIPKEQHKNKINLVKKIHNKYKKSIRLINKNYKKKVPNLKGMQAIDAIVILEKMGLRVKTKGIGIVTYQSLAPKTNIKNNKSITLTLKKI